MITEQTKETDGVVENFRKEGRVYTFGDNNTSNQNSHYNDNSIENNVNGNNSKDQLTYVFNHHNNNNNNDNNNNSNTRLICEVEDNEMCNVHQFILSSKKDKESKEERKLITEIKEEIFPLVALKDDEGTNNKHDPPAAHSSLNDIKIFAAALVEREKGEELIKEADRQLQKVFMSSPALIHAFKSYLKEGKKTQPSFHILPQPPITKRVKERSPDQLEVKRLKKIRDREKKRLKRLRSEQGEDEDEEEKSELTHPHELLEKHNLSSYVQTSETK